MSLLVRSEIFRLYVNTLTAYGKYSRHYKENFSQPIQMQLPIKQNVFPDFFIASLKST